MGWEKGFTPASPSLHQHHSLRVSEQSDAPSPQLGQKIVCCWRAIEVLLLVTTFCTAGKHHGGPGRELLLWRDSG